MELGFKEKATPEMKMSREQNVKESQNHKKEKDFFFKINLL